MCWIFYARIIFERQSVINLQSRVAKCRTSIGFPFPSRRKGGNILKQTGRHWSRIVIEQAAGWDCFFRSPWKLDTFPWPAWPRTNLGDRFRHTFDIWVVWRAAFIGLEPYRACTHGRVRYKPPPSSRRYFVFTHGKSVTYFHLVNRLLLKASSFVIKNSYSMAPKGRLCENFNSWSDTLDDILVNSKSPISVCWKLSYSSILLATILII